jgi:hypothetical protein
MKPTDRSARTIPAIKGDTMLGFSDAGALLAYLLTIGAALLCIVYGILNWNKPSQEEERKEIKEETEWEKREDELADPESAGGAAKAAGKKTGGR